MTSAAQVKVTQYYESEDVEQLYDEQAHTFEKLHVATFQTRKNIQIPQAIELAMELPKGAFISGNFVHPAITNDLPKDYDIFFCNEDAFLLMVKRIHQAPEGSFLHGYESDQSVRSFVDAEEKSITFVHATKPAIQLHRLRWFRRPEDWLDKADFRFTQFALDHELNMHFNNQGIDDCRLKRVAIIRCIFYRGTSLRLKRLIDAGWNWLGINFDTYNRDEMLRHAADVLTKAKRKAKTNNLPEPQNIDGYGAFEEG